MKLCIWPRWELRGGDTRVHLQPAEGLIVLALLGNRYVTTDDFVEILWPDVDKQPDSWRNCIYVPLSRLRAEMLPFGWTILNEYGQRWWLEDLTHQNGESRLAAANGRGLCPATLYHERSAA